VLEVHPVSMTANVYIDAISSLPLTAISGFVSAKMRLDAGGIDWTLMLRSMSARHRHAWIMLQRCQTPAGTTADMPFSACGRQKQACRSKALARPRPPQHQDPPCS